MICRFARVLMAAVLLGGTMLAFPFHPSAASSGPRGAHRPRRITLIGHSRHPVVGHFTVGKDTYTYSVNQSWGTPQGPGPEPEVWPLTLLRGPAVEASTSTTVTVPDECDAGIESDSGFITDFTIQLHLFGPNGVEIAPTPDPVWTNTQPTLGSSHTWNMVDPVEGSYTCRADIWVYDYEIEPAPTDVKTLSYVMPTGETTTFGNWVTDAGRTTIYHFLANVIAPGNANLSGRLVREQDGGNTVDTCNYPGSPVPRYQGIDPTEYDHPVELVSPGNLYGDEVGMNENTVQCFRANMPGCFVFAYPCRYETDQNSFINVPGGSPDPQQYKTNRIKMGMESTYVWSYRDGQAVSKTW